MTSAKLKTLILLSLIFISLPSEAQFWKRKRSKAPKEQVVDKSKYTKELRNIDSLLNLNQLETVQDRILKLKAMAHSEKQTGYYLSALNEQMILVEKQSEDDEATIAHWNLLQEEMKDTSAELSMFLDMSAAALLKRFYDMSRYDDRIADDSSVNPGNWSNQKFNKDINTYINRAMILSGRIKISERLEPALILYKKPDIDLSMKQVIALAAIDILNGLSSSIEEEDIHVMNEWALSGKDSFMRANFMADKDEHNYYRILQLYQVVLSSYHIYFDLQRLKFAANELLPSNTSKLIWAYYQIAEKQASDQYSNLALLELAEQYRWSDPAKALILLNEGLKRHPDFKMNPQLVSLKDQILRSSLLSVLAFLVISCTSSCLPISSR